MLNTGVFCILLCRVLEHRREKNGFPFLFFFGGVNVFSCTDQSCPVPATMAEAVVEGRRPLIVRPIGRRPASALGTSARSTSINFVSVGSRPGDVPGYGSSDDFEEVSSGSLSISVSRHPIHIDIM